MRYVVKAPWLVPLAFALAISLPPGASGTEHDSDREERSAQLIYNTVHMAQEANAPSPELIAQYRRSGSTSKGVGYRTQAVAEEDGKRFVWSFQVAYLDEIESTVEFVNTNFGPFHSGGDAATGADIYVLPEDNRIWFVLLVGNISLNMTFDRDLEEADDAVELSLRRWHFFIEEARRLGILEETDPPTMVVRIWDPETDSWRALEDLGVFTRRLADLHTPETLMLEIDVDSEEMLSDQPYEFEINLGKGGEHLALLEGDGITALGDADGDGWYEVRVEPVEGEHPPRVITARFDALADKDESIGQKAIASLRYKDRSGEVRQDNLLERTRWVPIITHFELRADQLSAQFHTFLAGRMDADQQREFQNTRKFEGLWFNGEFNKHDNLLLNWEGQLLFDEAADDMEGEPGFENEVLIFAGSQSGIFDDDKTVYMGWTLDKETGLGFVTMEDTLDGPLEIGPFLARESVNLYVDLWIAEDVTETLDVSAANGFGPPVDPVRQQLDIRRLLEIGGEPGEEFEVSVWHVDQLPDLRGENGSIEGFSETDFPRIKTGLRKDTVERVMVGPSSPLDLVAWRVGDSRDIHSYFRRPDSFGGLVPLVNNVPLTIDSGIYELQLELTLQEQADREERRTASVALRFWVMDIPGTDEQRVIHGIATERVPDQLGFQMQMFEAAESGDLAQLQQAIEAGADVNAEDENGAAPIGWAASEGHVEAVRALIAAGADIHWQAANGLTALNVAVAGGEREITRLLIEAGAAVDERITGVEAPADLKGATPLMVALRLGQPETASDLIGLGADVNARTNDGGSPILEAARYGDGAIAAVLMEAGANPSAQNNQGITPLMAAASADSAEFVWLLIDAGVDIHVRASALDEPPHGGANALMFAAASGGDKAVFAMVLAGADVNATNYEGETAADLAAEDGRDDIASVLRSPESARDAARAIFTAELIEAARDGRWDYVQLLTAHGADIDGLDEGGLTPLLVAVEDGALESTQALLDAGADVNTGDRDFGATPLMVAAFDGGSKIVQLLLEAGASVNDHAHGNTKGEGAGWTALVAAASEGHADIVAQLLGAGADPAAVTATGQSALYWAKKNEKQGYEEVIVLLEAALGATALVPTPTVPAPAAVTWDFETGDFTGWESKGDAFTNQPTYGDNPTARGRGQPSNHLGDYWIGTYENRPRPSDPAGDTAGDGTTGTLTSPAFTIEGRTIDFLIGGGCDVGFVRAELLVDGQVVHETTGKCHETMERAEWDVASFRGRSARIRLVDDANGGWGHINFDDVRF